MGEKGFDWLLRRKGGKGSMVLISCCGARVEMGLLERFQRSNTLNQRSGGNAYNELGFYLCLNEKVL